MRALERDRDAGKRTWLQGEQTLGGWLEHWMTAILPLSVRWKTLSTYQSLMKVHVIPKMGAARLADVRPEALELLYGQLLNEGRSTHVVHAVHRVLRSALGEAVRRHHLSQNPATVARPPRVATVEIDPLASEECRSLLRPPGERRMQLAGPWRLRWVFDRARRLACPGRTWTSMKV